MKLNIICITIFLFAAAVSTVHAAESVSAQELVAFVDGAAAYAEQNGKEKAIAEFNNKEGQFVKGQLYIFADDFKGINLAHPMRPDFVGKSQFDLTDKNGVAFIQNMIAIAKTGSGLTYYIFANPADGNKDELKLVYVKKIDDNWWIGSGVYLPGMA